MAVIARSPGPQSGTGDVVVVEVLATGLERGLGAASRVVDTDGPGTEVELDSVEVGGASVLVGPPPATRTTV